MNDKTPMLDAGGADWDEEKEKKLTKNEWDNYPYEEYPLYALGVSNVVYVKENRFGLIFYESDSKKIERSILSKIIKIFPNDLILFETRRGFHFISFTLFNYDDVRVMIYALSKILGSHYGVYKHQLVLRVTPKKRVSDQTIVHDSPKFYKFLKKPKKDSFVSLKHLKTYSTNCSLPEEVLNYYLSNCKCLAGKVCFYYYRTKDD